METVLTGGMTGSVDSAIGPETTYVYVQVTKPSSGREGKEEIK